MCLFIYTIYVRAACRVCRVAASVNKQQVVHLISNKLKLSRVELVVCVRSSGRDDHLAYVVFIVLCDFARIP